ncbi:MAG TPA: GNAT family N-acetyltransferase [Baekduia sp.]|nr:GNAT family N-acetyltransferase [Baekduia sp.]
MAVADQQTVRTERLLLRRWTPADAEPLAAINADPRVMRFIGRGAPIGPALSDALIARFEREWDARDHGIWAVEELTAPGELRGFCGLTVPMFLPAVLPAVEVGWRLAPGAWGRGIATEAARAALAFGFERAGMREIIAIVHPDNDRSLRVCAKLGMTPRRDRPQPGSGQRLRVLGVARDPEPDLLRPT